MDQNNQSSGVVFEDTRPVQITRTFQPAPSKIIELTIKYSGGYIRDEKSATLVLTGFVVLAISTSIFLLFSDSSSDTQNKSREAIEKAIKATSAPR